MEFLRDNTPIEEYKVNGNIVYVKREDLSTIPPMPPLAKLRGISLKIEKLVKQGITKIGVFDTRVSKSGLGITTIAHFIYNDRVKVYLGYPKLNENNLLPPQIEKAQSLGAIIQPIRAGRLSICFARFRKILDKDVYIFPHGLPFIETAEAEAKEALMVPEGLLTGSLVICSGTATILSGVFSGLKRVPQIYSISAGKSIKEQRRRVCEITEKLNPDRIFEINKINFTSDIMPYYETPLLECPFPSHPNYDVKAWFWLLSNIEKIKKPILFWNIGA